MLLQRVDLSVVVQEAKHFSRVRLYVIIVPHRCLLYIHKVENLVCSTLSILTE